MKRFLVLFIILICFILVGTALALELSQPEKLFSYRLQAGDNLGYSTSASGDMVALGAPTSTDNSGAVYLFDCGASPCTLASIIRPRGLEEDDLFGTSLVMVDDLLIVGAPGDDDGGIDTGAVYFYQCTDDGCQRTSKVTVKNASSLAEFGTALTFDGDTLIVGAPAETNSNGSGSGAAYVFSGCPGACQLDAKLMASDGDRLDQFGSAVALDEETVIVGAPNNSNESGLNAGAVYSFTDVSACPDFASRDEEGTRCTEDHKLIASTSGNNRAFGAAVDINGNVVIVGAPRERARQQIDAGGVFVYTDITNCESFNPARESATACTEDALLQVQNARLNMLYGSSVEYDGTQLLVGAPETPATNQGGSVYIYDDLLACPDFDPNIRTTIPCRESERIQAPDRIAGDQFGYALALTEEWLFVGAPGSEETEYNPDAPTATPTLILLITPTPTSGPPPLERNTGAAYAFNIEQPEE